MLNESEQGERAREKLVSSSIVALAVDDTLSAHMKKNFNFVEREEKNIPEERSATPTNDPIFFCCCAKKQKRKKSYDEHREKARKNCNELIIRRSQETQLLRWYHSFISTLL